MRLSYDEIKIKKRVYVHLGSIDLVDNGINVLIGENGTGKTLLLKSIFDKYQENAVFVDQENEEILTNINILQNITMSLDNDKNFKILNLLEELEIQYLLELNPKKMSGGEKRIVSVLRGLLSEKVLIIMDEPTNDLDYILVDKLIKLFQKVKRTSTLLIVTHDDRLINYCEQLLKLKNGKIISNSENYEAIKTRKNLAKSLENLSPYIVKKVFPPNYIVLILTICVCLFSILIIQDVVKTKKKSIPLIYNGQIDIFNPLTSLESSQGKGAYPISVISMLNENESVIINAKTIQKKMEDAEKMPITFNLNIKRNINYQVFPLEYYDPLTSTYCYPLDIYIDEILMLDSSKYYLDTSDYFELPQLETEGKEALTFDILKYGQSLNIISNKLNEQGKSPEILCSAIVLNDDYSFFDFISSTAINEMAFGNYYIRSNETIVLTNQVESFEGYKRNASIILCIGFVLVLILALYTATYLIIYKKNILILKNYGIDEATVKNALIDRCSNKRIKYICCMLILLSGIVPLLYYNSINQIGNHFIYVLFLTFICLAYWINKLIIKKRIKTMFRWCYR